MAKAFIPFPMAADTPTPYAPSSWGILNAVGAGAAAYHGYKRNRSIGWALLWGACGAFAPIITNAIGLAQGFSKPAGGQ